jgi:YggT family protein
MFKFGTIKMFMTPLHNALLLTIYTAFNLYIIIVLFRFLLQLVRANLSSPLAKLAVKATNPVLMPLNKIIPSYRQINFAALIFALVLQALELYIILAIKGFSPAPTAKSIGGLLLWGCGELLDLTALCLLFAIIIQAIISWVQPNQYNPNLAIFAKITDPLLAPIRRIIPAIMMIDFSPLIMVFLLSLFRLLIADPIVMLGKHLI